jgi:hypothetical protein
MKRDTNVSHVMCEFLFLSIRPIDCSTPRQMILVFESLAGRVLDVRTHRPRNEHEGAQPPHDQTHDTAHTRDRSVDGPRAHDVASRATRHQLARTTVHTRRPACCSIRRLTFSLMHVVQPILASPPLPLSHPSRVPLLPRPLRLRPPLAHSSPCHFRRTRLRP